MINQVHRVQFNFRSQDGFNGMFQALHALSLPIKRQIDRSRPQSATICLQDPAFSRVVSRESHPQMISNNFGLTQQILPGFDFTQRATSSHTAPAPPTSSGPENVERPFTAPVATSQMLPPKRQLPFPTPKPKSTLSSIVEQPSAKRAHTSNKAPARAKPRPKPNTPRKLKAHAMDKFTPSPTMTAGASSHEIAVHAPEALSSTESWNPPTSIQATPRLTLPSSRAYGLDKISLSQPSKALHQDSSSLMGPTFPYTPVQEENGRDAAEMMHSFTVATSETAPRTSSSPFKNLSSSAKMSSAIDKLSLEDVISRIDTWVRQYGNSSGPSPSIAENSSLAEYASKSNDERDVLLDNFICNALEDEHFVKFAEDVCGRLRRTGLML